MYGEFAFSPLGHHPNPFKSAGGSVHDNGPRALVWGLCACVSLCPAGRPLYHSPHLVQAGASSLHALLVFTSVAVDQATHSGFGLVSSENVFRVCDQPHPLLVAKIVDSCLQANIDVAYDGMKVRGEPFWYA